MKNTSLESFFTVSARSADELPTGFSLTGRELPIKPTLDLSKKKKTKAQSTDEDRESRTNNSALYTQQAVSLKLRNVNNDRNRRKNNSNNSSNSNSNKPRIVPDNDEPSCEETNDCRCRTCRRLTNLVAANETVMDVEVDANEIVDDLAKPKSRGRKKGCFG